jgi:CubicO group peptidase (beta-lactamase class C family)
VEDTVIRGLICTLLAAFLQPGACAPASGQTPGGPPPLPADTAAIEQAIEAALVNRVEAGRGVGLVVGILTPEGRRFLTHGRTVQGGDLEPGPDTVFEIGSISKVFTSLLLADMVERGEMRLEDPVAAYLPDTVTVPERSGRAITLADLATHTSGLPRLPTNLDVTNLVDPYATYGPPELYAFLSGYDLPRDPGAQWEYSNLGAGLLGHVLARHAGTSYEALLRTRILEPLGLDDTTITLSPDQRARAAQGYDMVLSPAGLWSFDALAGAGAIRSTADDVLTFAAAWLGLVEHPLEAAMARALSISRPGASPAIQQHLGWLEIAGTVLFHDGGTAGHRSALALRPSARRAVLVLSNSFQDVNDVALHGVIPQQPLAAFEPPRERVAVDLDEARLEEYVGAYEIAPSSSIEVTRDGGRLFAQAPGQPRGELAAEQIDQFFVPDADVQISFVRDADGAVTGLVLHLGGTDVPARRIR